MLSYCYALYIFGDREILTEMLSFLNDCNYQVRCSAIATLEEILDESNENLIKQAITDLLVREDTIAVKSRAEDFMKKHFPNSLMG